jgi:POT family proton-dependent oligopeptide transporter
MWLVSANVVIAVGEICLSPMGLSLVNRLAPPRIRGLMMGGWFVSLALGGYLAGSIGGYWKTMTHSGFFMLVVGIVLASGIPLTLMVPRINRTIRRTEQVAV